MNRRTVAFLCAAVALVALCAVFFIWYFSEFTLDLGIRGDREITMEVGNSYLDTGAYARFQGKHFESMPRNVEVTTRGEVNTNLLGTYKLIYTAGCRGLWRREVRVVHVVDTQAPLITLTADPDKFTLPGKPYEEEGFQAIDNYDGDLTANVVSEQRGGEVTYTVTDSSGNVATVKRTIVYNDITAPVLTLVDGEQISIKAGTVFLDPGCSAIDDSMGNISGSVTVTGEVDTYRCGDYELTYSAADDYGNTATVTRKVTVVPPEEGDLPAPNGKVIYLTFDDGPGPDTGRLLDILAAYNVKATFFVVNTGYISTIARAAQEGHTVAIHTATHRFDRVYRSDEAYFADLHTMQEIIRQYTGETSMLLRFPGGSSNTLSKRYNRGIMTRLTAAVQAQGYQYFDWNVDSNDAGGASTGDEVFENVIAGVAKHDHSVVLQHDIKSFSVDAVERILIWGLENGYRFERLTADSPTCHHGVSN